MLTFITVALFVFGIMHIYALRKVWLAFPRSLRQSLALTLFGVVMTISPLIIGYLTKQNWYGSAAALSWVVYIWMGFLFLFCITSLIFDSGHTLATMLGFKWRLNDAMTFRITGLLGLAMLGYGLIEARQIKVEEVRIVTPKLSPSIGRVTIAQISDLHLGMMLQDEFLKRVISRLREIKPDIVVLTGDVVDKQGDSLDRLASQFLSFHPPKGSFAVIGNHEYYAGLENSLHFLRSSGFTVLRGESQAAGGIVLVGVDDPSVAEHGNETAAETRKTYAADISNAYTVLLKHQPVVDREVPFDLQLSGHIHGGQIFPFGLLTRLVYGLSAGLTQLPDGRLLYVNRGVGTWGPPIRFLAAPEITLFKIECVNLPQAFAAPP